MRENKKEKIKERKKRKRGLQGNLQTAQKMIFLKKRNVTRNRAAIEAQKHILSTREKKKNRKEEKKNLDPEL